MLKLKNVSKFYYNKGVVASGFNKINLNLNIGEFVAITGESGSGKSTLLNVISGLDTYEEGEMYINGEETSYYNESDFEEYRKKYIANIFQNFNLINSYTVYQNVELMYIMNGITDDVKNKIYDLLKEVGLYKYRNTKASKLSGGQKQRVAIARALAKDTPIIVADEPTGNLDSKNAKEIVELLHKVSKNKLVIVVTHNYEQIEKYVTRLIKMHDGKIIEDIKLSENEKIKYKDKNYGQINIKNIFKLSFRNTFNVIPKFLLLLLVYSFLTFAVFGLYTSNSDTEYNESFFGFNQYFINHDDERIIIKKKDKSTINNDDYNKIENIENVDYIVKDDIFLDSTFSITNDDVYIYGNIKDLKEIETLDLGVMPQNDNEIVLGLTKDNFYLNNGDGVVDKEYQFIFDMTGLEIIPNKLKVVGIKYIEITNIFDSDTKIYLSSNTIELVRKGINSGYSSSKIELNNNIIFDNNYTSTLIPSNKVEKGKVVISEDLRYYCKNNYYCTNNDVKINISNLYYDDSIELKVSNLYTSKNLEKLTGYTDYDRYIGSIFINDEDYYSLFDRENYQSSVFIKDTKKLDDTISELDKLGYSTLHVKDTLVDITKDLKVFTRLFKVIGICIALVALFFISYFIIKIILKSRNTYFSIIRILGATKRDVKLLLNIELNCVLNIAYILLISLILLVSKGILKLDYINNLIQYLKLKDYIILYIILFVMSILISNKFAKKLFKSSAMKTYRED